MPRPLELCSLATNGTQEPRTLRVSERRGSLLTIPSVSEVNEVNILRHRYLPCDASWHPLGYAACYRRDARTDKISLKNGRIISSFSSVFRT